jgi:alkanesulfonate monooxygenase SsuD/methylene tetrahydromethanopterin reductase-like flavin-dependent oxidoreductase (luciferase family)
MPDPVRVGCVFRPDNPPEALADAARVADDVGLDELWLWEDCFLHGGLTAAAVALANTTRLVLGIGVLPVPFRHVALTAMEIATLERTFPGRLRVGIGHGVQDWMAQVGARVASPLSLLREYTTALSALLRGEALTVAGRYVTLSDVRLDWPPATKVDLLLAATGPSGGHHRHPTRRRAGAPASGHRLRPLRHRCRRLPQDATGERARRRRGRRRSRRARKS